MEEEDYVDEYEEEVEEEDEEEDEDDPEVVGEDLPDSQVSRLLPVPPKVVPWLKTWPVLTRFEKAALIGTRARMIEEGAPVSPLVTVPEEFKSDPKAAEKIATMELHMSYRLMKNLIPLTIDRPVGPNMIERIRLIDEEAGKANLELLEE
jgi:DNA-directed RNA polymerase subunit K/omega